MTEQIQVQEIALTVLDPDSPVPLYHQIEEDLRRLIQNGTIPSEALLPPEKALSQAYNVGRHTMRMALSRLVADGLISRRAGRGTIVKRQADRTQFFLDRSFTRQMADMGRRARTRVLKIMSGIITAQSPAVFTKDIGAPCLQLNRLRFGDEEPMGIQLSTILTAQCPDLAQHDFNQAGLYDILSRDYQLTITEIRHTITATIADEQQADLLQIETGDPLVVVNTTTFLDNQALFEYTTSYYRADAYEYSITHTMAGAKGHDG